MSNYFRQLPQGWARAGFAAARLPMICVVGCAILIVVGNKLGLDGPEGLLRRITGRSGQISLWLIFAAAFIEGALVLGAYLPGSLVIIVGIAVARDDPLAAAKVIAVASLGWSLSAQANFFIGRIGVAYKSRGEDSMGHDHVPQRFVRCRGIVIILSFATPLSAAMACAVAGARRFSYPAFFLASNVGVMLWNSLAGAATYHFAPKVIIASANPTIAFTAVFAWALAAFMLGSARALKRASMVGEKKVNGL